MYISMGNGLLRLADVDVRHLSALQAVAEERSFGRAADRLGFTQSAVSQQVAQLERAVGAPLFFRPGGPKPVELTPAGELLLGHAEAILERLRLAGAELTAYQDGKLARIAVGTFQSVSVRILPEVITRLRAERPDVEVTLFESDDQESLLTRLDEGDLDAAFVVDPVPDTFAVRHLCRDPFLLVSPAAGDLVAGSDRVPAADLVGAPLIGQAPSACQLLIEDGLAAVGVDPNVVFRTTDNGAVQAMVRAGMGQAVMPRLALDLDDPGLIFRRLDPDLEPRNIGLATAPRRPHAPAVDVFIEIAVSVCAALGAEPVPLS